MLSTAHATPRVARLVMRLGASLAALLAALLAPAPAHACQCPSATPEAQLEHADVVFEGRVTAVVSEGDSLRVSFHVTRRWKGDLGEDLTLTTPGGRCRLRFEEGAHWIVLATRPTSSGGRAATLVASPCDGSLALRGPEGQALIDLAEARLGPAVVPIDVD